jgi:hypothetical protein
MSHDTGLRVAGMSSAELFTFDEQDADATSIVQRLVDEANYIKFGMPVWLHGGSSSGQVHFLVVFLPGTPTGIARTHLISDLSDRGITARPDPL